MLSKILYVKGMLVPFRYILWQFFNLCWIKGNVLEKQGYMWKNKVSVDPNIICSSRKA